MSQAAVILAGVISPYQWSWYRFWQKWTKLIPVWQINLYNCIIPWWKLERKLVNILWWILTLLDIVRAWWCSGSHVLAVNFIDGFLGCFLQFIPSVPDWLRMGEIVSWLRPFPRVDSTLASATTRNSSICTRLDRSGHWSAQGKPARYVCVYRGILQPRRQWNHMTRCRLASNKRRSSCACFPQAVPRMHAWFE